MLVVVGGHTRNIGKTSVAAGLIAALPELNWTAIKITQLGHGVCSSDGRPCECAVTDAEHPWAVSRETDSTSGTDSSRYLAAGARQSYWVRTPMGQLGFALPEIRRVFEGSEHTIVESNSILQFFKPDLYFAVMDFGAQDFKATSLAYLDRADALIVIDQGTKQPLWRGVARKLWESKQRFCVRPPQYVTPAMAAFVKGRLSSSTTASGATEGSIANTGPGNTGLSVAR
jgi:hypothetical protein